MHMPSWRTASAAVVMLLFGATGGVQAQETCAPETGYQPANEANYKSTDPSMWCSRSHEYWTELLRDTKDSKERCSTGTRQSPIALTLPGVNSPDLREITIEYEMGWIDRRDWGLNRQLQHNGHTVVFPIEGTTPYRRIVFNGDTYVARQMHFHYPSEHVVNGERFPLEIHIVHSLADGRNRSLVLTVLVRKGEQANDALNAIFLNSMPLPANTPLGNGVLSTGFSPLFTVWQSTLQSIVPENKSYATYSGSLTTPSCDENITWVLFTTPLQATQAQIDRFRAALSYRDPLGVNARPLTDEHGPLRTSEGRSVKQWISR